MGGANLQINRLIIPMARREMAGNPRNAERRVKPSVRRDFRPDPIPRKARGRERMLVTVGCSYICMARSQI
jgi:hypothetical protein